MFIQLYDDSGERDWPCAQLRICVEKDGEETIDGAVDMTIATVESELVLNGSA